MKENSHHVSNIFTIVSVNSEPEWVRLRRLRRHLMGEEKNDGLRLDFDPRIRLEFVGNKITSDAGLLAYRELDYRLGLTSMAAEYLTDTRTGKNICHHLVPFFRQSIYSRLAGYADIIDANQLACDPAMRTVVGRKAVSKNAAPKSSMGRFETKILTHNMNRGALERINALWLSTALRNTRTKRIILDMDSSVSKVHGNQEGGKYNGHFECVCFHPIFCFNHYGDCEGYLLREGNVSSADRWLEVLAPIVARHRGSGLRMLYRGDAGFARPEVYEYLELEGYEYAIRLPGNQVLNRELETVLEQRGNAVPGRPAVVYHDFQYQAGTWNKPRRVVAKIEWHAGELFPRVGFIVTNRRIPAKGVVHFYNGRGTCEQWIKEGKYALNWMRLSCHKFKDNAVRLALFVLAYNLGNFFRRFALPEEISTWSLTSLKERVIKVGAKLVMHSRRLIFQMAEVSLTRGLFSRILERIRQLEPVPG
jgi:hypothetical protein